MAHSGIPWIDYLFNLAVHGLAASAKLMGISYEEINVYLFVFGWPASIIVLLGLVWWYRHRYLVVIAHMSKQK